MLKLIVSMTSNGRTQHQQNLLMKYQLHQNKAFENLLLSGLEHQRRALHRELDKMWVELINSFLMRTACLETKPQTMWSDIE